MPALGPDPLLPLVTRAQSGDVPAVEALVRALSDPLYRLALRMTANPADAEDATQEILVKVVTHLASFLKQSSVRTWAWRIAVRHLLDMKKSRVEALSLDFERFGADLLEGLADPQSEGREEAEEVKLGCSLAMLTCLDREHRVAFLLGEVFDVPNALAAEIIGTTEAAYRQRLSRAQRKVEAFTRAYCGVVNERAPCRCDRRVAKAVELGRLARGSFPLARHAREEAARHVKVMEGLHDAAKLFRSHPEYRAPAALAGRVREILRLAYPRA
jgi:RNA polymerase sigma factor (sigma-70 family)